MHIPRFRLSKMRPDLRDRYARVTAQAADAVQTTEFTQAGRHVVVISRLDEYHFGTLADRWPKLKQLTIEASSQYTAFGELLQDLFYSLYLATPRLRTKAELLPSFRVNADLMHQVQGLDLWRYSREHSRLNEGASMIGTVTIATEILKGLPEETKEESQQTAADQDKAQQRRDELKQALDALRDQLGDPPTAGDQGEDEGPEAGSDDTGEAGGAGEESSDASQPQGGTSQPGPGSGAQGEDGSGAGIDLNWDFGLGDESDDETNGSGGASEDTTEEEAEGLAPGEEGLSEEEQTQMEAELEAFLDEMERQGQELAELRQPQGEGLDQDLARRIARSALTKGEEMLKAHDDAMTSWGVDPKEWNTLPIGDRLDLAEKLTEIPALKEFAAEIGRMRQQALWALRQPGAYDAQEIIGVTVGGDINSLLDIELMALVEPNLELLLYARIAMEEVLEHEYMGRNPSGRGPFIVVTDISGSMEGVKERWAKAFIIAALEIAKKDNRDVAIIFFDTIVQEPYIIIAGGNATLSQKLQIAERGTAGGTNWQAGLEPALANIEDDQGDWKSADIVLVTDGIYQLPLEFEARYVARCKARGIRTHGVLLDCGAHNLGSLRSFCDQAYAITTLQGVGVAQPIFRQMALKP